MIYKPVVNYVALYSLFSDLILRQWSTSHSWVSQRLLQFHLLLAIQGSWVPSWLAWQLHHFNELLLRVVWRWQVLLILDYFNAALETWLFITLLFDLLNTLTLYLLVSCHSLEYTLLQRKKVLGEGAPFWYELNVFHNLCISLLLL